MNQKKGYNAQAMPELEAKIKMAPKTTSITTSGMTTTFFPVGQIAEILSADATFYWIN